MDGTQHPRGRQRIAPNVLALWASCRRCGYALSCSSAFPANGHCPHPREMPREERTTPESLPYPIVRDFVFPNNSGQARAYRQLLDTQARFASLHERAQRRLFISADDFEYLRTPVTDTVNQARKAGVEESECYLSALSLPQTYLIVFVLQQVLNQMVADFILYYDELEAHNVEDALPFCLVWAIDHATTKVIAASEGAGMDWGVHLIEVVRQLLWALLVRRHLSLESISNDDEFRRTFEAQWQRLMDFRGLKFDFRVVPLITPRAMARYQELPRGDITIRNEVVSYIVHQATAYPHLPGIAGLSSVEQVRQLYRDLLRGMFTPLVRKAAERALDTLCESRVDRERLRADVVQHAWNAYDEAVTNFRFHFPYSGAPTTLLGLYGFLGLAESEGDREVFDAFLLEGGGVAIGVADSPEDSATLASTDFTHVLFSHYLQRRLDTWLRETYPHYRDAEPVALQASHDGDAQEAILGQARLDGSAAPLVAQIIPEEPTIVSTDGMKRYFTIQQAARRLGVSVDQLRYLERRGLYQSVRLQDLTTGPDRANFGAEVHAMPPQWRLYLDTSEAWQSLRMLLDRIETRSVAAGEGSTTRKVVAKLLGVTQNRLCAWEKKGLIIPERRGRTVVYNPECIAQARRLAKDS